MATKTILKTEKKPKVSEKTVIIIAVSILLLAAIGLGTFFTLDYVFVDTPYDSVYMPDHIQVAKYMGATISYSAVEEKYLDSKDALLDEFTKKVSVNSGELTQGMNVTVGIDAKLNGQTVTAVSYNSYEMADIGNHEASKDKELFEAIEKEILEKIKSFDFSKEHYDYSVIVSYTYPATYSVEEIRGKTLIHDVYLTGVTTTSVPELNDDFFKNNKAAIIEFLGKNIEFGSAKEFEDYMREEIALNLLWNSIVEQSNVKKFPKKFIKKYEKEFDSYYDEYMEANGMTRAQMLEQMNTDEEGYATQRTSYAEGIVKEELVLYEIIQAEKIRVNKDYYKKTAIKFAKEESYGTTVEDFENAVGKKVAERTVIWEKVKDYLLDNATWVD